MKTNRLPTTLVAVALALLAAPVARADIDQPAPGVAAAQSGPKDYSKNAATGDYARSRREDLRWLAAGSGIRTSSLAGTTSATSSPARSPAPGGRFNWGDAGLGAADGFVLALAGAACVLTIRRLLHECGRPEASSRR